jgi:4-hydroxymandelate oxidase
VGATGVGALCVDDFRQLARDRLPPEIWDFIEGGSGAERTVRANRAAFDGLRVRPRVLVDCAAPDTTGTLLGTRLATPLGIAPTAYHRLLDPEGELATARAAGAAGALYVVSMFASQPVEEIAAAAGGPLWLQLYWLRRRDALAELVKRAEAAGYGALVLTVDTPRMGRRLRDMRNGFAVDPGVRAVNVDPDVMAASHHRRPGASALAAHSALAFDPSLSWSDLDWLRGLTGLPIVLKGVLSGADAARARSTVDAVIVSNHGGRQLDGAVASLDALAEVVDAVAGACPVLFDGGVRCGTDAFTALSLGAAAVLLGRPVLWALAAGGGPGVAELLGLLHEELTDTMVLAGRPALTDLDRSALAGTALDRTDLAGTALDRTDLAGTALDRTDLAGTALDRTALDGTAGSSGLLARPADAGSA